MQILQRQNKGPHLTTIERFYIHAEYLKNNHLNDESTIFRNIIFETFLKPHQPENPTHAHTPERQHQKPNKLTPKR